VRGYFASPRILTATPLSKYALRVIIAARTFAMRCAVSGSLYLLANFGSFVYLSILPQYAVSIRPRYRSPGALPIPPFHGQRENIFC